MKQENINISIKEQYPQQPYINLSELKDGKLSGATIFLDQSNIDCFLIFSNNCKSRNINFLDHILSEPSDSSVSELKNEDFKTRRITKMIIFSNINEKNHDNNYSTFTVFYRKLTYNDVRIQINKYYQSKWFTKIFIVFGYFS